MPQKTEKQFMNVLPGTRRCVRCIVIRVKPGPKKHMVFILLATQSRFFPKRPNGLLSGVPITNFPPAEDPSLSKYIGLKSWYMKKGSNSKNRLET